MGFKTRITCDWCGKELPDDEILGVGDWSYDAEMTRSQRTAVACCPFHRKQIELLWQLLPESNETEEPQVFLTVVIPESPDGNKKKRKHAMRLIGTTFLSDGYRKLTITGTVDHVVLLS